MGATIRYMTFCDAMRTASLGGCEFRPHQLHKLLKEMPINGKYQGDHITHRLTGAAIGEQYNTIVVLFVHSESLEILGFDDNTTVRLNQTLDLNFADDYHGVITVNTKGSIKTARDYMIANGYRGFKGSISGLNNTLRSESGRALYDTDRFVHFSQIMCIKPIVGSKSDRPNATKSSFTFIEQYRSKGVFTYATEHESYGKMLEAGSKLAERLGELE